MVSLCISYLFYDDVLLHDHHNHTSFLSKQKNLKEVVTVLWTFKLPWSFAYQGTLLSDGFAQFAFGMYSIMLTSSVLGFITMLLYRPRTWCAYCPMGTMTQTICKLKNKGDIDGIESERSFTATKTNR